ncbi:MAG: isocitrate/isopropylmalate dehydrogenase family protein [Myxococcota bacterium]
MSTSGGKRAIEAVLIPGDGIGPEVSEAAVAVVEAAGVDVRWQRFEAGASQLAVHGTPLPKEVLVAIHAVGLALKGPIATPIGTGFRSANVTLRQSLDLYACVRPVKIIPTLAGPYADRAIDLVIVRENTEDLYAGLEHRVAPGVCESIKVVTEAASLRIARFAFELAQRQGRRTVTVVHKANIMKLTDGLFLDCARRTARDFADVELREMIIDNCAMQLVLRPEQFDVLLLPNLYGDIVSDLAAGLVGGLGLVPGANVGASCAVFEAVHGSAPDIAGKGVANPSAIVLSAAEMVRHVGEDAIADRIVRAVHTALADPVNRTRDLGGDATTASLTRAIIAALGSGR